ncbi:MAG: cytochrome c [Thermoanaerobaculia bacterium]
MSTVGKWVIRLLALVGLVAITGAIGFVAMGLSSRSEPPVLEVKLARSARHLMIPAAARRATNPLPPTPELHARALRHWADHCASCHGNGGKGDTSMGRSLYPRAPDMTRALTQQLSDGELFWIIENGVKLTGMPAWGSPAAEDDAETWELVHFIRRLPSLTEAEVAEMKKLNPLSRADLEQEMEMERFLAGDGPDSEASAPHHAKASPN